MRTRSELEDRCGSRSFSPDQAPPAGPGPRLCRESQVFGKFTLLFTHLPVYFVILLRWPVYLGSPTVTSHDDLWICYSAAR